MVDDSLTTELERLKAENERLKRDRGRAVSLKVSKNGRGSRPPPPPQRAHRPPFPRPGRPCRCSSRQSIAMSLSVLYVG